MKKKSRPFKKRFNKKVVLYSIIALVCLVLGFTLHWIFVIPAVIFMIINQKKLIRQE